MAASATVIPTLLLGANTLLALHGLRKAMAEEQEMADKAALNG